MLITGLFVTLTDSRTALVFAGGAAVLHAVMLCWRRFAFAGFPEYRRRWIAAMTPFVVLALAVAISGGVVRSRFPGGDVTSGRVDTWRQVATDWQHAGLAEKVFGDARTSRAVVIRLNDGAPPQGPRRKLNTDNAAVGAIRRGGVLGGLAFLLRRAAPVACGARHARCSAAAKGRLVHDRGAQHDPSDRHRGLAARRDQRRAVAAAAGR